MVVILSHLDDWKQLTVDLLVSLFRLLITMYAFFFVTQYFHVIRSHKIGDFGDELELRKHAEKIFVVDTNSVTGELQYASST